MNKRQSRHTVALGAFYPRVCLAKTKTPNCSNWIGNFESSKVLQTYEKQQIGIEQKIAWWNETDRKSVLINVNSFTSFCSVQQTA